MKKTGFIGLMGLGVVVASAMAQDEKPAPKGAPAQKETKTAPKEAKAAPAPTAKEVKEKVSYFYGFNQGMNLKKQGVDLDPEAIVKGMVDGLAGKKSSLSDEEVKACLTIFEKELAAKQAAMNDKAEAEAKVAGETNKKEGEAFLAANKTKPGVKTLASGLQYKVLKEGAGATPKIGDTFKAHYKGTLLNGTEFDSSYNREPLVLPVKRVIPGWQEALQLMKVGSKWQLFVPSNLAYGETGRRSIPPNSVLIFEMELLGIE